MSRRRRPINKRSTVCDCGKTLINEGQSEKTGGKKAMVYTSTLPFGSDVKSLPKRQI